MAGFYSLEVRVKKENRTGMRSGWRKAGFFVSGSTEKKYATV
jgi:hypothetical protein